MANGYKRNETKFIKDHIRTPRIQNLQNAVDVLIEDEKPKTSHRRLFQNEKLTIGLPENAIEDMLDSIGLKNYANIFAEERISVEDFLTLSDKDLEGLNVTFEARKLISQCTASGIWDISKANKF